MDLWEALVGPSRWEIPGLVSRPNDAMNNAWLAQCNALSAQQGYAPTQAALERQAWRASVSQNWLNAMIDVELGI